MLHSRRHYPWLIAAFGPLIIFVSNGLTTTAITVFDAEIIREFGLSRGDFKLRDAISYWGVALLVPFTGMLVDRVGPKRMILFGMALLALGYWWYARVGSLQEMYAIHALFAVALACAGTPPVILLVSSWFRKYRGLVIGLAVTGTSFGTIVLSPLNGWLIENFGWRQGFLYESALPLAVLLLVALLVRNTPGEVGRTAVGQAAGTPELRSEGLTFAEAIRTRTFWAIGLSGMLLFYTTLAFVSHLFLHMTDLGYELGVAKYALSIFGLVALVAKFGLGWIADVVDRHKVFFACLGVALIGVVLLATMQKSLVWAAIVVFGLGWGGLFTLYNMLVVNNLGLRNAGTINGSISFMESLGGGLGIWLTGVLYDRQGSYEDAFRLLVVLVVIGIVVATQVRDEVARRRAGVAPPATAGAR
ncbi:MAG: MFS transporter [Steroidobacteraceae bacterium]|jgi:sugar phosphate permease|nr:MFS transporter [Steroidobacteraceae bacterium]